MKKNIKIQMAGIRNIKDALMCVAEGVDIIGLLVGQEHTSDDFLTIEEAKKISDNLPNYVEKTLITHLVNADEIIKIANTLSVDNIQLHSAINENEVEKIASQLPSIKLIRLIHISQDGTICSDISKIKYVDYYFTDSFNTKTNQVGGTGLVHNFFADKELIKTLDKPVFVAGGLNYKNVAQIIELTDCYGVDVNNGCRAEDGGRSRELTEKFVKAVKMENKELYKNIEIIEFTEKDIAETCNFIKEAFLTAEVKDGNEQDFFLRILYSTRFMPSLTLVAKMNNKIVGFIMLCVTDLKTKNGVIKVLNLGPIAVKKELRNYGIGTRLIYTTINIAKMKNFKAIFLAGNPNYYKRFGFVACEKFGIKCNVSVPKELLPNIMCLELDKDFLKDKSGVVDLTLENV